MDWLEKLKDIIKINIQDIKIGPIISINYSRDSHNISSSTMWYFYDSLKKNLHINPDTCPDDLKKHIQLTRKHIDEGHRILEYKTDHLLEELYNYNKDCPDMYILTFFKEIILPHDYEALHASLFLRNQHKRGMNISGLKDDIRKRFGDRGNNISNLCTAGYFEGFLIPLYNSSKEDFQKLYDVIISKSIMALFVHKGMNETEIPIEIANKFELCKKYGIKFIHIHGIGKYNIGKIRDCIEKQKEYFDFFEKKIYENEKDNIIVVELLFK